MQFHITPLGDTGLRIHFGEKISPQINQLIRRFAILLEQQELPGVIEWIPTYTAISISYNPYIVSYHDLKATLIEMKDKQTDATLPPARIIHMPTCYGGDYGPDLAEVAKRNGLREEEVISIHTASDYLTYMMGFTPGFPYLGGMSQKIATPRLAEPRAHVPKGSVGIAGSQTGVYPMSTPGGWQLIGRTPLKLYDPYRENPILLQAGDYLKFIAISKHEYQNIERQVQDGTYEPYIDYYTGKE
ncbi:5-oxoprolinase subunit PxpB [Texcoconibacillus texcoconensis]|uniref:Inhibitor of KinA n=1 Tax=Texcoconibacillus texcoconensis TaxID=1095777 RepID=A0A840QMM8_9BACI|nr:5-oxoprolinase subunit PxpB [Texcoconibacillus texcoconensis]MBB5172642.1 inhibitor of KinA [Texcoconibacillus texcoconensis]